MLTLRTPNPLAMFRGLTMVENVRRMAAPTSPGAAAIFAPCRFPASERALTEIRTLLTMSVAAIGKPPAGF